MTPTKNIYHSPIGRSWLLVTWSIMLCWLTPVQASIDEQIQIALDALDKQEFERAKRELHIGLRKAEDNKDKKAQGKVYFYLGLTLQQQIEHQADLYPHKRAGWLKNAQLSYERARKFLPKSGGVRNNLAQIYEKQGELPRAGLEFRKAILYGADQQVLYRVNYADFLLRCGKDEEAVEQYEKALEKQPANEYAQRALLDYYTKKNPSGVGEQLRKQLGRGQVKQVLNVAITMLQRNTRRPRRGQGEELLTIIVMCLTRLSNQPQQSLRNAIDQLKPLTQGRWAGPVREIFNLYEEDENRLQPRFYRWWAAQIGSSSKSPPGGWPLEAFQSLIRSLGGRLQSSDDAKAEAYYLLALRLNHKNPDARALVKLADFYEHERKPRKTKELLDEEESRIFGAKADAIKRMDLKRRFEYHRSLGIIYGHLNKWGDENTVQSAVFQLNSALRVADDYNKNAKNVPVSELIVEPRLVNTLADGYITKRQANKAFELRANTAYNYRELGVAGAATKVFRPIATSLVPHNISPDSSKRYKDLKKDFRGFESGLIPRTLKPRDKTPRISDRTQIRKTDRPAEIKKFGTVELIRPKDLRLSQRETNRLTQLLQLFIQQNSSIKLDRNKPLFLTDDFPNDIVRIEFDSKQGKIYIERRSKKIEIPFTFKLQSGSRVNAFKAVRR